MRITLIGGVERNERALAKIAQSLGHVLDFHGGHMNGRGDETTDVNSHTAVMVARNASKRMGRELVMMRSCNPTRFRELLTQRNAPSQAA
jgi:hypothetical protein